MEIISPSAVARAQATRAAKKVQDTPAQTESQASSPVRDAVALGAGAGAAVAGGIYGFGEGLVTGAIKNYPAHVKGGAEIGKNILTPVGGAVGAILTGFTVGTTVMGGAIAGVVSLIGGPILSTAGSALSQASTEIKRVGAGGAARGEKIGGALGDVGATVGKYVGGAFGGIGGAFVALAKGLPAGYRTGESVVKTGAQAAGALPQFSKDVWNTLYNGGHTVGGGLGQVSGGLVGVGTGTGHTLWDGTVNSTRRATQWAKATSGYIKGEKPVSESSVQEPAAPAEKSPAPPTEAKKTPEAPGD